MNDSDLERFHDNYLADDEAMPIIAELHAEYGESFLCECLRGDEVRHTLTIIYEVKKELKDRFLLAEDADEHTTAKELRLDTLFPNLVNIMSYEKMLIELEERGWISYFRIMRPFAPNSNYRSVKRIVYAKGYNWDKCPKAIQDHFLTVKAEGNTKT